MDKRTDKCKEFGFGHYTMNILTSLFSKSF